MTGKFSRSSEGFNKITVTLEWSPDKWVGYESWTRNVGLLLDVARAMGMDDGRTSMDVQKEIAPVDDPGWEL